MGILARLEAAAGGTPPPTDPWWYTDVSPTTASGISVTAERALCTSAVWQAVRILTEGIASYPLITYRRREVWARERVPDHPLYDLLRWQPNTWQTAFEFWEMVMGHLVLRGNAYAQIVPGPRGFVDQLVPLHPDRMQVGRLPSGRIRYTYTRPDGRRQVFTQDEIFHLRGLSSDGLTGLSVLAHAREAIGLTIATEAYGARFFGQSPRHAGILEHPGKLDEETSRRLAASFRRAHAGPDQWHRVAVLEQGMTWKAMGMTAEDAQFLATREFQVHDVARWFNVPVSKLFEQKTPTFNSLEAFALQLEMDSFRPWTLRIEQAVRRDLILEPDRYFAEFLFAARLRADSQARAEYYRERFNLGSLSPNDIRRLENENPIADPAADRYYVNAAVVPLGDAARAVPARTPARAIVAAATARVVRKEIAAVRRAAPCYATDPNGWADWVRAFYAKHVAFVREVLTLEPATARAYCDQQAAALLATGVSVLEGWEASVPARLTALVVDGQ